MPKTEEIIEPILTDEKVRALYYRFMHVMIELLERHDIRYFAHSGTMLGCVRHGGFVPWDDDIDIMIPLEDEPRLEAIRPEFARHGVRLRRGRKEEPADGLWQFRCFGKPITEGDQRYYGFDIFIGEEIELENGDRVYHYQSPDFRRWYKKRYVKVDDVFPRKRFHFGPLSVWGMRDPSAYFQRSEFTLDSATIHVHKAKKDAAEKVTEALTALGKYPIRDPEILNMAPPFAPTEFFDLEHYRISDDEIRAAGLTPGE